MEMLTGTKKVLFLSFLFLTTSAFLATSHEVDDESEFSYDVKSENGPAHWGKIHSEWRMCNAGKLQSPIDLLNKRVKVVSHLGRLRRNYKPSNATLINRGHDMMLRWEGGGGHMEINGSRYELKQAHWHTPSEHTIDGRRFALEVHLVHENLDGKTAVVGIMYKTGRPDSFLTMIENDLRELTHTKNVERGIGRIDPKQVKFGSRKYYRYIGSLTVPPCDEDVVWTILKKVRTVTKEQMKLIREAVHDESETNSRPLQKTNKRPVKMFRPNDRQQ